MTMMGPGSLRKKLSFRRKKHMKKSEALATCSTSFSTDATSSPRPLDGSFPVDPCPPRLVKTTPVTNHRDSGSFPVSSVKQSAQKSHDQVTKKTMECAPKTQQNNTKEMIATAAALDTAGNDLLEKGDYHGAMKSYERALELKRQSLHQTTKDPPDLLASVATSINNIGFLRQRSGASPKETMAAYQDSLRMKREILGNNSLSVGKTLNNIGSVHYSSKEYSQALQSYTQAKSIMEFNLGPHHLDVATVVSNIGDVYMAQSKRAQALQHYKQALCIRWMHLDEHNAKVRRLLEKIAVIEMNQDVSCDYDSDESDEDRMLEEEIPVQRQLHKLRSEVQADIKEITILRRKMALDMLKDKLRILKEMRNIDGSIQEENDDDGCDAPLEQARITTPPPLSPLERQDALSSVKQRLVKLREQKAALGESMSSSISHEEEDAEMERQLGLDHLALPKLNLESILGS